MKHWQPEPEAGDGPHGAGRNMRDYLETEFLRFVVPDLLHAFACRVPSPTPV